MTSQIKWQIFYVSLWFLLVRNSWASVSQRVVEHPGVIIEQVDSFLFYEHIEVLDFYTKISMPVHIPIQPTCGSGHQCERWDSSFKLSKAIAAHTESLQRGLTPMGSGHTATTIPSSKRVKRVAPLAIIPAVKTVCLVVSLFSIANDIRNARKNMSSLQMQNIQGRLDAGSGVDTTKDDAYNRLQKLHTDSIAKLNEVRYGAATAQRKFDADFANLMAQVSNQQGIQLDTLNLQQAYMVYALCVSGFLSPTVASVQLIRQLFESENFEGEGLWSPAFGSEQVDLLFSERVAQCQFGPDDADVRLLVPMVQRGRKYTLFQFTPLSFMSGRGITCRLSLSSNFYLYESAEGRVIPVTRVDLAMGIRDTRFRLVPTAYESGFREASCIVALLHGSSFDANCTYICEENSLPIFTRDNSEGAVFISNVHEAQIESDDESQRFTANHEYGTLMVTLPCGASIVSTELPFIIHADPDHCEGHPLSLSLSVAGFQLVAHLHNTTLASDVGYSVHPEIRGSGLEAWWARLMADWRRRNVFQRFTVMWNVFVMVVYILVGSVALIWITANAKEIRRGIRTSLNWVAAERFRRGE